MDQPIFKRQFSHASSNSSVWEPFQEERIRARAVDQETQNALANVGLKARMNVDRGYKSPHPSLETQSTLGSKPIFRTTTHVNSQVSQTTPLWSRTQSAPIHHLQELQPFALSNSNSGFDSMEEEWIQSRRKGGSENGMAWDSTVSSPRSEIEDLDGENRPIGANISIPLGVQVKRGRDLGDSEKESVLERWAEEDDNSAVPHLSTSSSTLESPSFPPNPSNDASNPLTLQRTISNLPSRSLNKGSDPSSSLGNRPLTRVTQSMPISSGFFVDPYSGLGSSNSSKFLNEREEMAKHLREASLARKDRNYEFNDSSNGEKKKEEAKKSSGDEMEVDLDLQTWIQKQEGF